jgi:hypothetical protein
VNAIRTLLDRSEAGVRKRKEYRIQEAEMRFVIGLKGCTKENRTRNESIRE